MQGTGRAEHSTSGKVFAITVWLIGVVVVALGAKNRLPQLASEHGAGIDLMIGFTLGATGFLILAGHAVLGWFLWRYSAQPRPVSRRLSLKQERGWALVVALFVAVIAEGGVLVLGLPVWGKVFDTAAPDHSLTIEITTEQFAWNVRYAGLDGRFGRSDAKLISLDNPLGVDSTDPAAKDDIIDLNTIRVEVNRPVRIRLRSKDVLHSFFLPNLRVKQDAVPGMTIDFWFMPTKAGTFELACAELCGFGHYDMRGVLLVMPPQEFRNWFEGASRG